MATHNALRQRRAELGLTQAELAAAAGVSRQLVAAVEAGVNTPAVDAALRLADSLECSVDELFVELPVQPAQRPAVAGARRSAEHGPFVVAGCDPALGVAEALLTGDDRSAPVLALDATTGTALRSLRDGGVHAAVVHGRVGHLKPTAVEILRLQLARWQVGLGVAPRLEADTLAACLERSIPIVQRQESASSQQALRRAAGALNQGLPAAAIAAGHVAAARAAASIGCAAITTEGAALMSGLRFIPLETHTVEIWVDRRWQQHPGLAALGDVLSSSGFATRVSQIGGYDLTGCGSLLPPLAAA